MQAHAKARRTRRKRKLLLLNLSAPPRLRVSIPTSPAPTATATATATAAIATHGHVLTPGRYVGAEEVEDDGEPFEEKMPRLVAELHAHFAESDKLEAAIRTNLKELGYAP